MLRRLDACLLGLLLIPLSSVSACGDDGGIGGSGTDDTTGETSDTGDDPHFELRTISGGTLDVMGMNFVQCYGDPTERYTRVVVQFDPSGMTMVESQHDDPTCGNEAIDAASFTLEGGPAGDQTITGWEPGHQPAHVGVPIVGTRVDVLRVGEDGQKVPTKTTLLVDDGVVPPRIYSGNSEGPIDDDGFPVTMYDDFLSDLDAPIWGTWVATTGAEIHDLDGGSWTRCVVDEPAGVPVFERWSFDNDRLTLQRYDQGDDPLCTLAQSGTTLEDGVWVVTVTNDLEAVSWAEGSLTATELRLSNSAEGRIATRLVVLDEGSRLFVSTDGLGFEPPKQLEATALEPE